MKKYFTLTGTKFYYGSDFLEPGMKVVLVTSQGVLCKVKKEKKEGKSRKISEEILEDKRD